MCSNRKKGKISPSELVRRNRIHLHDLYFYMSLIFRILKNTKRKYFTKQQKKGKKKEAETHRQNNRKDLYDFGKIITKRNDKIYINVYKFRSAISRKKKTL